jgi:type II secretory pathway pseudopilin PulG
VATSLIEATATVAVGAVLAGVAVGSAIDAINDSKIQAAIADVQTIGQGIITFYKDNSFFPLFRVGNQTGPSDAFFKNLVSRNGTYPADLTTGTSWGIPASGTGYATGNTAGLFGHDLGTDDDSIEAHPQLRLSPRHFL